MRPIERSEILPLEEWERVRAEVRARMIERKKRRRVAIGPLLTVVFENRETVLLQIQEMLRTERIRDERAIAHEIATYGELVPASGELSATLFVEVEDREERGRWLTRLAGLGEHVWLRVGADRVRARFLVQPGEERTRLPAVNFFKLPVGPDTEGRLRDPAVRVALEVDHPAYEASAELPMAVRMELAGDLLAP
ncbi:MAG: DUF3501 family protein [Myxococcota bacterium]|nr:DUF3501 family protein [Myxococcota bacterium]MDW8362974.1 DUF3501 family protein [Myxococcales bacterium]